MIIECHLGFFASWFGCMSDIKDRLYSENVCLGLHIDHPSPGFVIVLSSDV